MFKAVLCMKITDLIVSRILDLMEQQEGTAEIQRNELASLIGCVPSQISYVISSRFTPEQGYLVESRRGGGGYIRITRITRERPSAIMHVVNSIGESIDPAPARAIVDNLEYQQLLPAAAAPLIRAALHGRVFSDLPQPLQARARARLLKQLLLACL